LPSNTAKPSTNPDRIVLWGESLIDKLLRCQSVPTSLNLPDNRHNETLKSVIDVPVQSEPSQEDDSEITLLRSKKRSRSESEGNTETHKEEDNEIHQLEIRSNPVNVVQIDKTDTRTDPNLVTKNTKKRKIDLQITQLSKVQSKLKEEARQNEHVAFGCLAALACRTNVETARRALITLGYVLGLSANREGC